MSLKAGQHVPHARVGRVDMKSTARGSGQGLGSRGATRVREQRPVGRGQMIARIDSAKARADD